MSRLIGFTGTQKGATRTQLTTLASFLSGPAELGARALHHGDCIGADSQAHLLALDGDIPVVLHPASTSLKRAWSKGATKIWPAKPPLDRNRDIVDATDVLIACPFQNHEILRSGTWATVRYARKQGKQVIIVWPDGSLGS